jgi:hypothetical protein
MLYIIIISITIIMIHIRNIIIAAIMLVVVVVVTNLTRSMRTGSVLPMTFGIIE